jgi:pseudouridine-5'-phosphate glycosidase
MPVFTEKVKELTNGESLHSNIKRNNAVLAKKLLLNWPSKSLS